MLPQFVKLTTTDNRTVWVNFCLVECIYEVPDEGTMVSCISTEFLIPDDAQSLIDKFQIH
jgi:hypothetical protein